MTIRIVNNKRLDMTEAEFALYNKICQSYTVNNNKGEDLFIDLFEVDSNGLITMLIPPSKRQTSFEVWLFLTSLFTNQRLRVMHEEVDSVCSQMVEKMKEMEKLHQELLDKNKG